MTASVGSSLRAPVARHADGVERVGWVGWVAKGVLYVALAFVVWELARQGDSEESADQVGALEELAHGSWSWLLVVVALGLFAYAAWRLCEAALGRSEKASERAGAAVSGVVHLGLGVIAVRLLLDDSGGSGTSSQSTDQRAAGMMGETWGRVLVGAIGVILLGVAIEQARRAWTSSFLRKVDTAGAGEGERRAIEVTGRLGHAARAVVYGIVGGFLTVAAIQADADDAKGLDGSLREVAGRSWGSVLLAVTAVGLALYGVYCIVSSRRQRLVDH